jgi:RNA polymerase sigma-70 factor (ECF subfamily)
MYVITDQENGFQSDSDTSSRIRSSELELQIEKAIQTLPTKCAEVFRMSRFNEYSYKEIAEKLDISIKTVENHIGKALKLMRQELEEYLPALIVTILLMNGW